ncbi:MAG: isopentenyl-diphosphate Delta-isomerase [Acidobacteriota bacterium]
MFIALAVSAFFMANVAMPGWSHVVSSISVVLFAVPCIWATKMWLGLRDAIILLGALALLALVIEMSAITTGFPYGHFGYSEHLGYKLFAVVPWTVAFAWPPLLLAAYSVAANVNASRSTRLVITTVSLLTFDLVLDPGAVQLGFWKYAGAGVFYGVPLSNFAGWIISGFVGAVILEIIVTRLRPLLPVPVQLSASAVFIIWFWSAFAAFAGMIAPALIGLIVLIALAACWRKFHYHFDDKIVLIDEHDNAVGTASKLESHNADTKLHRAFSAFIFNRRGELLLQQRALTKKTWPGVWSNSCCGHVMLHEATARAAERRLKFELGMSGIELVTALPDFRYCAEKDGVVENEICPVLIGVTDAQPFPNPSEVANVRWIDWNKFLNSLGEPETDISPWAKQEVRLLTESEVFSNWFAREIRSSDASAAV